MTTDTTTQTRRDERINRRSVIAGVAAGTAGLLVGRITAAAPSDRALAEDNHLVGELASIEGPRNGIVKGTDVVAIPGAIVQRAGTPIAFEQLEAGRTVRVVGETRGERFYAGAIFQD